MYILIVSIYIYIYYDTRFLSYSLCQHRKKEPRRRSNGSKSRVQGTAGIGASPGFLLRGVLNIYIYTYDIYIHDMIWYDMISYIYAVYIYIWYQGARDETRITQLWPSDGTPDSVVNPGIPLGSCHAGYPKKHSDPMCPWFWHQKTR